MSKGPGSAYDKWNISVVIVYTDGYNSNHQINMNTTDAVFSICIVLQIYGARNIDINSYIQIYLQHKMLTFYSTSTVYGE
jgi:hypothetical protein